MKFQVIISNDDREKSGKLKAKQVIKCILSYYVPVQTVGSPYDANYVTPLYTILYIQVYLQIFPFLGHCIVRLKFLFFIVWNHHATFS